MERETNPTTTVIIENVFQVLETELEKRSSGEIIEKIEI
tara:strand:+ start:587 stop:703 length:117 start_codon:yes stop_codon:yes gene_type:complete